MAVQEQGLSEGARAAASSRGLILASRRQQLLAGLRHALVLRRSAPAPVLSWLGSLRVHGGPASEHNRPAKTPIKARRLRYRSEIGRKGERLSCLGEEHRGEGGGCFASPPVKTRCAVLVTPAPAMWRASPARQRTGPRPEEFHIHTPIPHQIVPQRCSRHQVTALWCWTAVTPRKCSQG